MSSKEKPPKGGWLGPPDTSKLAPLAIAKGSKNGRWRFKEQSLSDKEQRRHDKFQRKMREADKEGVWRW